MCLAMSAGRFTLKVRYKAGEYFRRDGFEESKIFMLRARAWGMYALIYPTRNFYHSEKLRD
jgi:5-hydroxyisourate hydrolase-like protein (transthyretin family)